MIAYHLTFLLGKVRSSIIVKEIHGLGGVEYRKGGQGDDFLTVRLELGSWVKSFFNTVARDG